MANFWAFWFIKKKFVIFQGGYKEVNSSLGQVLQLCFWEVSEIPNGLRYSEFRKLVSFFKNSLKIEFQRSTSKLIFKKTGNTIFFIFHHLTPFEVYFKDLLKIQMQPEKKYIVLYSVIDCLMYFIQISFTNQQVKFRIYFMLEYLVIKTFTDCF